jgi:hypothetical protein
MPARPNNKNYAVGRTQNTQAAGTHSMETAIHEGHLMHHSLDHVCTTMVSLRSLLTTKNFYSKKY